MEGKSKGLSACEYFQFAEHAPVPPWLSKPCSLGWYCTAAIRVVPGKGRRNSFSGLVESNRCVQGVMSGWFGWQRFNKRCQAQSNSRRPSPGPTRPAGKTHEWSVFSSWPDVGCEVIARSLRRGNPRFRSLGRHCAAACRIGPGEVRMSSWKALSLLRAAIS